MAKFHFTVSCFSCTPLSTHSLLSLRLFPSGLLICVGQGTVNQPPSHPTRYGSQGTANRPLSQPTRYSLAALQPTSNIFARSSLPLSIARSDSCGFHASVFVCQAVGWSIGRLFFTRAVPHCVPHLSNGDCYMLTGIRSSALPLIFHFPIIQSPRLTSSPLSPPAKAQNISQRSSIPRCTPVPPAKAQGSRVPFFSPPDQAKAKTKKQKRTAGTND